MKQRVVAIIAAACIAVGGFAIGRATAGAKLYQATVRCAAVSEDSAAHLKLISFLRTANGIELFYRCKTRGY